MTTLSAFLHENYLAVRIQGPPSMEPRTSLHIAFLLDISDSMEGERLSSVKRTLHAARPLFLSDDRVTLITFGSEAACPFRYHPMTEEGITEFYTVVDGLHTAGATNMAAALQLLPGFTYDMVILLTDGQVNQGISSTAGLLTLALNAGDIPFGLLGYGEDHNSALLQRLATQSCGSYTYLSSDELLPIAMGDLISGLRTEVHRRAHVNVRGGHWSVCELNGGGATYCLGEIIAGRDYWAVFRRTVEGDITVPNVTLSTVADINIATARAHDPVGDEILLVREQIYRVRAATVLERVLRCRVPNDPELQTLEADIRADPIRVRPLVARILAQIAEVRDQLSVPQADISLARFSSQLTALASQRGADEDPLFSSPTQRTASQQVRAAYTDPRVP